MSVSVHHDFLASLYVDSHSLYVDSLDRNIVASQNSLPIQLTRRQIRAPVNYDQLSHERIYRGLLMLYLYSDAAHS